MKNADVSIFPAHKSHKEQFNDPLTASIQQDERKTARGNCIIMIIIYFAQSALKSWQSVNAKDANELHGKY